MAPSAKILRAPYIIQRWLHIIGVFVVFGELSSSDSNPLETLETRIQAASSDSERFFFCESHTRGAIHRGHPAEIILSKPGEPLRANLELEASGLRFAKRSPTGKSHAAWTGIPKKMESQMWINHG